MSQEALYAIFCILLLVWYQTFSSKYISTNFINSFMVEEKTWMHYFFFLLNFPGQKILQKALNSFAKEGLTGKKRHSMNPSWRLGPISRSVLRICCRQCSAICLPPPVMRRDMLPPLHPSTSPLCLLKLHTQDTVFCLSGSGHMYYFSIFVRERAWTSFQHATHTCLHTLIKINLHSLIWSKVHVAVLQV